MTFRGRLVFKAHRLWYHSTLGLRVIKKKKEEDGVVRLGRPVRVLRDRIQGFGFWVLGFGFKGLDRVSGFGFKVLDRVSGFGFRVSGFGFEDQIKITFGGKRCPAHATSTFEGMQQEAPC